ncbi:nucleolar 12, 25 kDa protein [Toxoplasma gondii VAND]|uniref:Nucleolar 12, 25 kDa protein n=1 Tax=Toxoplasma gondii VAND TaxID=933077 RepID=A0A086PLC6_TOXGO|nr:nucleolar 12, 25 kDa protein [Toxoplasma gondii VAND]
MRGSARRTAPDGGAGICFDAKKRREFIEGFAKRKAQRRQVAKEQEARREKEERRHMKRQRQELLMKHVAELEEARKNARRAHARASLANRKEYSSESVIGHTSASAGKKRRVKGEEETSKRRRGGGEQESEPSGPRGRKVNASAESEAADAVEFQSYSASDYGRHHDREHAGADSEKLFHSVVQFLPSASLSGDARRLPGDNAGSEKTASASNSSTAPVENLTPWLLGCTVTTTLGSFFQPRPDCPSLSATIESKKDHVNAGPSTALSFAEKQNQTASKNRAGEDPRSAPQETQDGNVVGAARGTTVREDRASARVKQATGRKTKGGKSRMRPKKGKGKRGKQKRGRGRQ